MPGSGMEGSADVVVIGSGVGGMTTALLATAYGLRTVVLEKTEFVGGSTAYAAGGAFLPGCHHLPPEPDPAAPYTYLAACIGQGVNRPMLETYLTEGPAALAELEAHSEVRFQAYGGLDYRTDMPGAGTSPRTVMPVPFDGRSLGGALRQLRPPLPTTTILGGMQVEYADIDKLMKAFRSPAAMLHAAGLIGRHALGRLRHGRSPRLVFGNALAGRLFKSALDKGIAVRTRTRATALVVEDGRVVGVACESGGVQAVVRAAKGVMLASGGFPGSTSIRAANLPFASQHKSLPPAANSGDGIGMALALGARLDESTLADRCLTPVSAYTTADGRELRFPHFAFDRCKPGAIAVGRNGRRFVNEGLAYSEFASEMQRAGAVPAFLICDHAFLRRYGLGMVLPAPFPYRPFIRRGYLATADSIGGLATRLGIDAVELERSVARANAFAKTGTDLDFGKGDDAYSRSMGDAAHGPNPCLGPIERPPFYAVTLHTGDTATTCGLVVNTRAQVLDRDRQPIEGLYACGPDMANPTMGANPSGGCNIGPAITFGFVAARHMAGLDALGPPGRTRRTAAAPDETAPIPRGDGDVGSSPAAREAATP